LTRHARASRWWATLAGLCLIGLLESVALSTASEHAELAPPHRVSASVSPPFPSAASGDAALREPRGFAAAQLASSIEIPDIDALMSKAVRAGRTPGAVVLVGRKQGVVFRRAYGRRSIIPQREEMTLDTIFDLASLTKPMVIAPIVEWLLDSGQLALDDAAVKYLPEFAVRDKQTVTVEQLLLHTSGLPPTNSLHDFKHGPERARALTLGGWLYKYPGREFIYSDIGYIALGELIENITGEQLDQVVARVIWQPLGMSDTRYCPKLCDDPRIAPTELNYGWTKNPIRGEPSDTRVYRLGGVAGSAGVFSSAEDVGRYARMLLGEGELDGVRVLSAERVREMLTPRPVPKAVRALGWDVSSGFSSGRGHLLSDRAVGHSGYTGTSLWVDPALDLFVIFLSNRNHPFSTGKVTDLQSQVTDFAVRALYPDGADSAAFAPSASPREPSASPRAAPPTPARGCPAGDATCTTRAPLRNVGG
jgi:CubicO group peptidase (beta-lactamase class C family)